MQYVNKVTGEQQRLISSQDISVHDVNLGTNISLQDSLIKQQNDITILKSNVKWLYTYGGVGSGGSGSGGSSKDWSIYMTVAEDTNGLNEQAVTDGKRLMFSSTGIKYFTIRINYPGGSIFKATASVYGGSQYSITLNESNLYQHTWAINLRGNSTGSGLTVTVEDISEFTKKSLNVTYICTAYSVEKPQFGRLVGTTFTPITSGEFNIADNKGAMIRIQSTYGIYIDCSDIKFGCSISPALKHPDTDVSLFPITAGAAEVHKESGDDLPEYWYWTKPEKSSGTVTFDIPTEYICNQNSGEYAIQMYAKFTSTVDAQPVVVPLETLRTSFTIVSEGVYLMVTAQNSDQFITRSTYNDSSVDDSEIPSGGQGSRAFKFKVFDGKRSLYSSPYKVTVERAYRPVKEQEQPVDDSTSVEYEDTWINFGSSASTTDAVEFYINEQEQTSFKSWGFNVPGIWRIKFSVASQKNTGETYEVTYYTIITQTADATEWMISDGSYHIVHSSFYRATTTGQRLQNINVIDGSQNSPFIPVGSTSRLDNIVESDVDINSEDPRYRTSRHVTNQTFETAVTQKLPYLFEFSENYNTGGLSDDNSFIISIGVQISNVNQPDDVIFELLAGDSASSTYPNNNIKVSKYHFLSSDDEDVCLPTEDYDLNNKEGYHLIQYVFHNLGKYGTTYAYQRMVFIDGYLESSGTNLITSKENYYGIRLNQFQCSYNLISKDILNYNIQDSEGKSTYFSLEAFIHRFWCAYRTMYYSGTRATLSDCDKALLSTGGIGYLLKFNGESIVLGTDEEIVVSSNTSSQSMTSAESIVSGFAQSIDIPILVLQTKSTVKDDILLKAGGVYKALWDSNRDNDVIYNGGGASVDILYSPGRSKLQCQEPSQDLKKESSAYFTIEMQGTSTRENKSKNLTLTLNTTNNDGGNGHLVFSPNYDAEDTSTFLPEQSWTLKSDVVDSAHSNNTAIGKFINTLCKDTSGNLSLSSDILINSHQRLCLDGFPMLVFMSDIVKKTVDGKTVSYRRMYYMGYYNFNLGRSSYNNLACTKKDALEGMISNIEKPSYFTFSRQQIENRSDYGVAEISDNIAEFDFSQYDSSLLFGPDENAEVLTMYDHMVTNDENALKTALIQLNYHVARAGYYIFQELNKEFINKPVNKRNTLGHTVLDQNGKVQTTTYGISDAYKVPNIVNTPEYQTVYARGENESSYSRVQVENKNEFHNNPSRIDDVITCISRIKNTDDADTRLTPYLDYKYTVIYYVTVMAFGMVDSVLKNLNIKTWNLPTDAAAVDKISTFYPMFYDMDTAFELNNAGLQTIKFNAAMDYWTTQEDSSGVLKESQVLRDYWPQSSDDDTSVSAGGSFDFPCSYLFAIAKYTNAIANVKINDNESIRKQFDFTPSTLWTMLRKKGGLLESADLFMNGSDNETNPREAFFTNGMSKAGGFFINLNYRLKYLYVSVTNSTPTLSKISYFHGTRRQRVKEWLASRFYFLDQIFNLSSRSLVITSKNAKDYCEPKGGIVTEPYIAGSDITALHSNPDIYLLMDAFSDQNGTVDSGGSSSGVLGWNGTFTVTAPQNTPLVLRNSGEYKTYFLSTQGHNDNKISITENGAPIVIPFGSGLWKDVDTLNAFARASMYVNTDNLITARVTVNAKISQWTILGKRLQSIQLNDTSKDRTNYSGTLTYTGNSATGMAGLREIQVCRTKIVLDIDGLPALQKVDVTGAVMEDESLTIKNCNFLEYVIFNNESIKYSYPYTSNTTYNNITIAPYYGSIYMDSVQCGSINVVCKQPGQSFYVSGNTKLTTLTLTGFETVIVLGCTALTELRIIDDAENGLYCKALKVNPTVTDVATVATSTLYEKVDSDDKISFRVYSSGDAAATVENLTVDLSGLTQLDVFSVQGCPCKKVILPQHHLEVNSVNSGATKYTYYKPRWEADYSSGKTDSNGNPVPDRWIFHDNTYADCYYDTCITSDKLFTACKKLTLVETNYNNPDSENWQDDPNLTIRGGGIFKQCIEYKFASGNTAAEYIYPSIIFDTASLDETFMHTAVDREIAIEIIKNHVINKDKVVSVNAMFKGCTKLKQDNGEMSSAENDSKLDMPDFSEFTSCTDARNLYAKIKEQVNGSTNLYGPTCQYLNNKLLSFPGKDSEGGYIVEDDSKHRLDISNIVSAESKNGQDGILYIESGNNGVLPRIGYRLTSFYTQESLLDKVKLCLYNGDDCQVINRVDLHDHIMVHMPNLEKLCNIDTSCSIDFTGAFCDNPVLTTFSNCFNTQSCLTCYKNVGSIFLGTHVEENGKLKHVTRETLQADLITSIRTVERVFNCQGSVDDVDDVIPVMTFFPWETVLKENSSFDLWGGDDAFNKQPNFAPFTRGLYISSTYNDYAKMWELYYTKSKSTHANYWFYNTEVIFETADLLDTATWSFDMLGAWSVNDASGAVEYKFAGVPRYKDYKDNAEVLAGLDITDVTGYTDDSILPLKRVLKCHNTFEKFRASILTTDGNSSLYVRLWSPDATETIFNVFTKATDINYMFKGIALYEPVVPDFFKKRVSNKTECRVLSKTITDFNDYYTLTSADFTPVTYVKYTYSSTIKSMVGLFTESTIPMQNFGSKYIFNDMWSIEGSRRINVPDNSLNIDNNGAVTDVLDSYKYAYTLADTNRSIYEFSQSGTLVRRVETAVIVGSTLTDGDYEVDADVNTGLTHVTSGSNEYTLSNAVYTITTPYVTEGTYFAKYKDGTFTLYDYYKNAEDKWVIDSNAQHVLDFSWSPIKNSQSGCVFAPTDHIVKCVDSTVSFYVYIEPGTYTVSCVSAETCSVNAVIPIEHSLLHSNAFRYTHYVETIEDYITNPQITFEPNINAKYTYPIDDSATLLANFKRDYAGYLEVSTTDATVPQDIRDGFGDRSANTGIAFPCIVPDFFAAVEPQSTSGALSSNTNTYLADCISSWSCCGFIPEGIFKHFTDRNIEIAIPNIFSSMRIMPQLRMKNTSKLSSVKVTVEGSSRPQYISQYAEMYYYCFVPGGFTFIRNAQNVFNFSLYLPRKPKVLEQHHYVSPVFFIFDRDTFSWDKLTDFSGTDGALCLPNPGSISINKNHTWTIKTTGSDDTTSSKQTSGTYGFYLKGDNNKISKYRSISTFTEYEGAASVSEYVPTYPSSGDDVACGSILFVYKDINVFDGSTTGLPISITANRTIKLNNAIPPLYTAIITGRFFNQQSIQIMEDHVRTSSKYVDGVYTYVTSPVICASSTYGFISNRAVLPLVSGIIDYDHEWVISKTGLNPTNDMDKPYILLTNIDTIANPNLATGGDKTSYDYYTNCGYSNNPTITIS